MCHTQGFCRRLFSAVRLRKLTINVTQNISIYSNKQRARPLERKKLKSFFLLLQGQLIGVIGKVGSGKSSLLAAITAEMEKRLGEVRLSLRFNQLYDFEIVPGSIIKTGCLYDVYRSAVLNVGFCQETGTRIWLSYPGEGLFDLRLFCLIILFLLFLLRNRQCFISFITCFH